MAPLVGRASRWLLLILLVAVAMPRDAWAYLDPGTGSYIFQLVLASLLAGMFTLKLYWKRVKGWFKGTARTTEAQATAGNKNERRP